MRKDIFEFVKLMKKDEIKINYAAVARKFNCDYRTVKRYCEGPPEKVKERAKQPSKLDPFKDLITEKFYDGCTASAIYHFIKKQGYTGGYTILGDFCRKLKVNATKKATIRFETNPGLQAQVDWKEEVVMTSRCGEVFKFNIFLMVLGFSRTKFIKLTLDRNQDTLKNSIVSAFEFFDGVPKEILFDNMRTVIDQSKTQYKTAVINDSFYQFSKDFGFEVWACRAYRPQTKGKVEALAKFTSRIKPYDHEFDTLEELIAIVDNIRDEINNEISEATGETPFRLLNKEREYLQPMPSDEILRSYLSSPIVRIVSKESMVTYKTRKYSLSPNYIGKSVEIKENNGKISILYEGIEIASHTVSNRKFNYKPDHVVEILASDALKGASKNEIEEFAKENLLIYDSI